MEKKIDKKPEWKYELVPVDGLKPHPRNYRKHPEDQLAHIIQSIKDHGIYRNVVVTEDGTILAGHGVVLASKKMGMEKIPVKKLDIDPMSVLALKILTGDNEISHLGEIDDRELSELLKEINNISVDKLLGTGFTEDMLSNLTFLTIQEGEINPMEEWKGMPEYGNTDKTAWHSILVHFKSQDDLRDFSKLIKQMMTAKTKYIWFPEQKKMETESIRY
jgi:hypothetical protein